MKAKPVAKKTRSRRIWIPKQNTSPPNPNSSANHTLPANPQQLDNGWGVGPTPPPYAGFSFRNHFQYEGPSLLDGFHQENNTVDDPTDERSVYSEIEVVTDDFINGRPNNEYQFIRTGGEHRTVIILDNTMFMLFLGQLIKQIYTPRLEFMPDWNTVSTEVQYFLLNPLKILSQVWSAITENMQSYVPIFSTPVDPVMAAIKSGIFIDSDQWLPVALALHFLFESSDTVSWLYTDGIYDQPHGTELQMDQLPMLACMPEEAQVQLLPSNDE